MNLVNTDYINKKDRELAAVIEYIKRESGKSFDPVPVKLFLKNIKQFKKHLH